MKIHFLHGCAKESNTNTCVEGTTMSEESETYSQPQKKKARFTVLSHGVESLTNRRESRRCRSRCEPCNSS